MEIKIKDKQMGGAVLLTEGPIWQRLIGFALPLFWGQFFQQLYNIVDSFVVGNFLGSEALAAVSSSNSIVFLLVGFFNGLGTGAGVVISRYYGARDKKNVQTAIHTTIAVGVIAGLMLTIVGAGFTPILLTWMGTPAEVLPNSISYFRLYFAGSLALVLYNTLTGILQAVGDSKHPLIYLIISSVMNVVLDVLFVGVFNWGVGSAALATVISQVVSVILCLCLLMRAPEEYRVSLRNIRIDREMAGPILRNSLPAGLQNSIISTANVVIQSHINSFGKLAMAGCGAYARVENVVFLPINCFVMAITTFISQNLGAGEHERAKKGARFGVIICVILSELFGLFFHAFAPAIIGAFDSNPEVIEYGVRYARTVPRFFFLLAYAHSLAGILRGVGKPMIAMGGMLSIWCVFRIIFVTVGINLSHDIRVIFWAYPLTWILTSAVFTFFYRRMDWEQLVKTKMI